MQQNQENENLVWVTVEKADTTPRTVFVTFVDDEGAEVSRHTVVVTGGQPEE